MIEHVEEFRLELRVNPLGNREVLEDRHVRQEFARSGVAVTASVPEVAEARIRKWAALGNKQLRQWIAWSVANERQIRVLSGVVAHRGYRGEVNHLLGLIVEAARPLMEATVLAASTIKPSKWFTSPL